MRVAQVKKYSTYLLAALPGLEAKGRCLVVRPLRSILRAVYFDNASDPDRLYVQVLAQPLFVPAESIQFNCGWRLGGGSHLWNLGSETERNQLVQSLREEALPFLEGFADPAGFVRSARRLGYEKDAYVRQAIAYALARSEDWVAARAELNAFAAEFDSTSIAWKAALAARARGLQRLIEESPSAARAQLDRWENETAKHLGFGALEA